MPTAATVKLPSGKEVKLHNGDRGFFARGVYTLKCTEGWKQYLPWKYIEMADRKQVGKRDFGDIFPSNLSVSKHHADIACVNNYYLLKDTGSKYGSFVRLASSGRNKRVELHKGMTFSVGRVGFKVSLIEGDAADNRELKKALEEEARERAALKAKADADGRLTELKKKEADDLDSDEEFADTDDDDDDTTSKTKMSSAKRGKLDGPPVMFLSSMEKKLSIKGRIRETSTVGADKDANKIAISPEVAAKHKVSPVHARIVLEDGHFYLEDAGSSFGTYVGLPKKKLFELNVGDHLLLGGARCRVGIRVSPFQPLQGLVDKILSFHTLSPYQVHLVGRAPVEQRLTIAMGAKKEKKAKKADDDD